MTIALNPNQLARLAECASPDSFDSPGARFLSIVADAVLEDIEYVGEWDEERAAEIADGCVPVYTHEMWQTFVDLCAYEENPTELGADFSDMGQAASVCLYMIAERLAREIGAQHVDEAS